MCHVFYKGFDVSDPFFKYFEVFCTFVLTVNSRINIIAGLLLSLEICGGAGALTATKI